MKKFCDYKKPGGGKCPSEARLRCQKCNINCCGSHHLKRVPLNAEDQSFADLRAVLIEYLKSEPDKQFSSGAWKGGSGRIYGYRNFYEQVASKGKIPCLTEATLCLDCYKNEMLQIRQRIQNDFIPIVKEAQEGEVICGAYDYCYQDVEGRCSLCNKCFCSEHERKCNKCSQFFCSYCALSHHHRGFFSLFETKEEKETNWHNLWR